MQPKSALSALPFSEAILSDGTLYISGQIGVDASSGRLSSAGFEAEADQVMKNLGTVLRKFGYHYADLINVTIYLTSMENYSITNAVYSRYFKEFFPARVCIAVRELPLNASIEIAAIARKKPVETNFIPYHHLDVFTNRSFSGNGLTVFPESKGLSPAQMQMVTREMRQFESIFLRHRAGSEFEANVFTMEEELEFAGHPSLGAAALLHELSKPADDEAEWVLAFPAKKVAVVTKRKPFGYEATMNQGPASFGEVISGEESKGFLLSLGLTEEDVDPNFPLQVVSTGLPYLLVPVEQNLWKARILVADLAERLRRVGAKFVGILDIPTRSIRTWDNLGIVEDIATGSLAGPAAAYLVKYGVCPVNEPMIIHQGMNLGRPSELRARVDGSNERPGDVYVTGDVVKIAEGRLTGIF